MSLTEEQFQDQWENRDDDRSGDLLAAGIVMLILPPIAVALRFYCRKTMKVKLSWDDYFIVVAQILMLGLASEVMIGSQHGSGRHLVAVGLDTIVTFAKLSWSFTCIYPFVVTFVKLSILYFYNRIFPKEVTSKTWRMCWWALIAYSIAWLIGSFFATIFQCTPVSYFWTQGLDPGKGTCLDRPALLWASSVLTLVNDIAILVLPIPILWKLQMPQSKKFGILGIFLLGSFVVLTTIIRLCYINDIIPYDATWTQVDPTIWTLAEPGVAIICACLPVMSPLFRFKWQNIRSTSWFSRSKTFGKGSDPYGSGSGGPRHHFVQMPKKPAVTVEGYSKDKVRDEEMAIPLKDVGTGR